MPALASSDGSSPLTRRRRAGRVASAALRGGVLAAVVAAVAWLLAGVIAGTVFLLLVVATIAVVLVTLLGDRLIPTPVWIALAAAWAIVVLERWIVGAHGGLWVAAAAWLGVIAGARAGGIARWALPLLAYPLISVAICVAARERLLEPWGVSWLWVAAVLGPVLGARVLLDPSPREPPRPARVTPRTTR